MDAEPVDPGELAAAAHLRRLRESLALLRDVSSTSELVDRAAVAVCHLGFDRAIVSRVQGGVWVARAVHVSGDPHWAAEILRRVVWIDARVVPCA